MIEYFTRTTLAWWARRGIESFKTPGFAHDGPKVMLINAYAGSGGDALPYFFREEKLGLLIGTRTWGGLIGLSENPDLVDGGSLEIPTFRIYDASGHWVVENHGVDPDIEVVDDPSLMVDGGDPQLDRAIAEVMKALETNPPLRPKRPPYPVR